MLWNIFEKGYVELTSSQKLKIKTASCHINFIDATDKDFGNFNIRKSRGSKPTLKTALSWGIYKTSKNAIVDNEGIYDRTFYLLNSLSLTNCEIDILVYEENSVLERLDIDCEEQCQIIFKSKRLKINTLSITSNKILDINAIYLETEILTISS
jgi:hypothetical protein